ncbi:DUF732 domain-containing protein [Mycolicibacterium austroafricanum]|uniref:DUF732 domain-containing protein n=1 Tax=Mycolicibacterium austroafricanum TaxID=39687 RepID=A0ABT8HKY1_MYCAO|nr:DUF732 domain-containing protein [Mycolicibacterium austroafricanum]MDN4521399.1 DUF732 domain-containing protein [Mycolicibacterium austroafricanum]
MRPRHARAVNRALVLITLGWAAAAGMATARADLVDTYVMTNASAVCATLDSYPSVAGIEGIGQAIMDDGLTPQAAGEVVTRAIVGWCPEHLPELNAFIAKWTTAGSVVA